jgi:hypothetical protein
MTTMNLARNARKVQNSELAVEFRGVGIVDSCGFDRIIEPSESMELPVVFHHNDPLSTRLIPIDASIATPETSAIGRTLRIIGYAQVVSAIVERMRGISMVTLSRVSRFKPKNLPVHIDSFSAARRPASIPGCVFLTCLPRKPRMLVKLLKVLNAYQRLKPFCKRNDSVVFRFRLNYSTFSHASSISDVTEVFQCQQ